MIVEPGGFIDISHNAKNLCFVGTSTSGMVEANCERVKLEMQRYGTVLKFKKKVQEIAFNSRRALGCGGRKIRVAKEIALFEVTEKGLALKEIAPGVNMERDILNKMALRPIIPRGLKILDERIYKLEPM